MGSMEIKVLHPVDGEVVHTADMADMSTEDYEGEEEPARQRYASQKLHRIFKAQNHVFGRS